MEEVNELDEWLNNSAITLKEVDSDWRKEESKARLFPTCGGILKTMECSNKDFQYYIGELNYYK